MEDSDLGYRFRNVENVKRHVLSKLTKVATFGALLVGGLSTAGQNLFWITDDDEIVSNETTQRATFQAVGAMLRCYCCHGLGEVAFGIAGKFDDDLRAEDLCSIPDLVGGAIAESLTSFGGVIPESTNIYTPVCNRLSTKSTLILGWLATLSGPLKHLFCVVRPASDNQLRFSFASPSLGVGSEAESQLWTPLDKGWQRTLRDW